LSDMGAGDDQVKSIAADVWGDVDGKQVTHHAYGKGHVYYGVPLGDVLGRTGVSPDFSFASLSGGSKLARIHRRIGDAEGYFVSNQAYQPTEVECSFRVKGRVPELWHADSGVMEAAPIYRNDGNRTAVTLCFEPAESVFVVFRKPANGNHLVSFGVTG